MNGYLVVLRGPRRDYPVALYPEEDKARVAADLVATEAEAIARDFVSKIGWPLSDVDHVVVIQFENTLPVKEMAGFMATREEV